MLKMGIEINATGWMAKSAKLKACVQSIPIIVLEYEGQHSELHVSNATIAKHALAHGDNVFPIQQTTLNEMARKIRSGLRNVAVPSGPDNIVREMRQCVNIAVSGCATAVLEGKTNGPARTATWNAYKVAHFAQPTPNMVASREWLNSLRGRLQDRAA